MRFTDQWYNISKKKLVYDGLIDTIRWKDLKKENTA